MKSLLASAAWLLAIPIVDATNYQRMSNLHMSNAGLILRRDDAGCKDTYGGGSVVCGDQDSEYCYDPSIGESCCPLDNSYCNAGEYCAPITGYCCNDGEDLATCATRQNIPIPASLPSIPVSLLPAPASIPPSAPVSAEGLPMAGTEFPLPTIVPGPETVGPPLLQSATDAMVENSASLFGPLETSTASDTLPTVSSVKSLMMEHSDVACASSMVLVDQPPYPISSTATVTIPIETKEPAPTVAPVSSPTISSPVVTYTGAARSLVKRSVEVVAGVLVAGWIVV